MTFDLQSFLLGLTVSGFVAYAWYQGRQDGIRLARRVSRHGRNLDYVFFEDAERDVTITRPQPASADVREWRASEK